MADERVFKVKIDGLEKSYKDTVKLLDVLNRIKDVHAKVTVESEAFNKTTEESTNKTREKTKALTEEEKAQRKLEQTREKIQHLDTQLARENINATQALRARTQEVQREIQLENASTGSIDEKRLTLASLGRQYRALTEEERNAEHIGGAMLVQIQELREEYNQLERSMGNHAVNVGNYESATAGLNVTLENLSNNVNTMTSATNDLFGSLQSLTGGTTSFNVQSKESQALLNGLSKILALITKLNKSYTASTEASTAAQTANTAATGAATVATKTFSKALISTGIGALVVGLGLLVANFKEVKKWLTENIPLFAKLGENMDEIKSIAMGVGNAVLQYVLTPLRVVATVVKKIFEGDFKGAIEGAKNEVKNGLNVVANYEKGYQKEKANQEKQRYLERLELRKQELEDLIKDNEAKLGSDWKYSKDAQKAYKELYNLKKELYAEDTEELKNVNREQMSYMRELRDREAQFAKDREAEKEKEKARLLAIQNSLTEERIKSIEDSEKREIETLRNTTAKRLAEITGSSEEEKELRKLISENAEREIAEIQKKYREQRENKELEDQKKAIEDQKTLLGIQIDNVENFYDDIKDAQRRSIVHKNGLIDVEATSKNIDEANKNLGQYLSMLKKNLSEEISYYDSLLSLYSEDSIEYKTILADKEAALRDYEKRSNEVQEQITVNTKTQTDLQDHYYKELSSKMQETLGNIMGGVTAIFDAVNTIFQAELDEANEKYEEISQRYDEVVEKREESTERLKELEDQYKDARGGRLLVLQQQISDEMQANKQLADQEKNLAKEKEKQEKEIAKKEKQMKRAQILSDMVQGGVNTALAITNALTVKPFPLGVVLASVAGAMGAIQVGVMSKQLAKLEDGGLLKGNRHSQGGMRVEGTNIEVEGGEYVINRESTSKNLGLIQYINSQRRVLKPDDLGSFFSKTSQSFEPPFKRMFESGGMLPPVDTSVNVDNENLVEAVKSIKIEPRVAVTDINNAQGNLVTVDNWTGL